MGSEFADAVIYTLNSTSRFPQAFSFLSLFTEENSSPVFRLQSHIDLFLDNKKRRSSGKVVNPYYNPSEAKALILRFREELHLNHVYCSYMAIIHEEGHGVPVDMERSNL